jgi:hypothetical protein
MSKKTRRSDDVPEPTPKVPDKATLGYASLFAAFVAGSVLLLFVLPAEYGIDPTGVGRLTGISRLYGTDNELDLAGAGSVHRAEPAAPRNDTFTFTLDGGQDNEYKLHVLANQSIVYSWTATGLVDHDFHGEPDRPGRPGEFASYQAGQGTSGSGSFTAPFDGRHGWYVQNVWDEPVTITVQTWGYYDVVGLVG